MALVEVPGGIGPEVWARMEAEKARFTGLLEAALDLVKPWPSRRPGDRDKARQELDDLVWNYQFELEERNAGRLKTAKDQVKQLAKAARGLHDALRDLGPGALQVLARFTPSNHKDWVRAAGAALPPLDEGRIYDYDTDPETGNLDAHVVGPGAWVERTAALAEWAGNLATKMHAMAPKMGRKDLDTLLRNESDHDWLLRQLTTWMKKHEWDVDGIRTQLIPLAHLIHEAVMGEPAAPNAYRAAKAKTKTKTRAPKVNRQDRLVN